MSGYVDARLEQWGEYLRHKSLAPLNESRLRTSDIKLYRQEIEADRLTWVKRTHRAVCSLPKELREPIMLHYLAKNEVVTRKEFGWSVADMAKHYGVAESTISRRLTKARYAVSDFYQEELEKHTN